jgi:hypothetical protein
VRYYLKGDVRLSIGHAGFFPAEIDISWFGLTGLAAQCIFSSGGLSGYYGALLVRQTAS